MKKHFLFGKHAINVYKTKGINDVASISPDGYEIFNCNKKSTPEELMDAFLPWGQYIEITQEEVNYLNLKSNEAKWLQFVANIDPGNEMTDGDFIDYLMANFQVPEPRIKYTLYDSDFVLYSAERDEFERFDDGDIAIYIAEADALLHAKGRDYYPVRCLDLDIEIQKKLINQINRIEHD